MMVVHHPNLNELDSACRYLQNCSRRPAWVDRECEYAWKMWLQTLPTTWEKMLAAPFDRRLIYLTGEAPAFMSLVQPSSIDRQGLELISDEGGVPLHLDLCQQHRNIVFGRIQPVDQQSFVDILQLSPDVVARNAGKNFYPAKEEMYSKWLLDEGGVQTFVRYYSPPVLLAVVANNPQEALGRKAYMDHYQDPYKGLVAFANELTSSLRESRPFRLPTGAKLALEDQPELVGADQRPSSKGDRLVTTLSR
jgi:hypothetical protein